MSKKTDIHAELDGRGALPASKLPEWPPLPYPLTPTLESECEYRELLAEAALARMEALAKELSAMAAIFMPRRDEARQHIDELLAACARKEAGR